MGMMGISVCKQVTYTYVQYVNFYGMRMCARAVLGTSLRRSYKRKLYEVSDSRTRWLERTCPQ